jgi:ABC-type transporter Mla subunit MlaD
MTTATRNQTASQAYNKNADQINYLLGYLDGTLETHRQRTEAHNKTWSEVADLNRALDQLIELVGDLSGRGRESIEKSLKCRP